MTIQLIVGLGNPGSAYKNTRHNSGAWLITQLAEQCHAALKMEKKFSGSTTRVLLDKEWVHLLRPATFMNCSGLSVANMMKFYRLPVSSLLVVHDELDFPAGVVRLKQGGGHGGHNGLKDIIAHLGRDSSFYRLRIGIGHPGDAKRVADYVLKVPSCYEKMQTAGAIEEAIRVLPDVVSGAWDKAVRQLHA